MFSSPRVSARRAAFACVCCVSLPLGGCFTAPTAKAPDASGSHTTSSGPKGFSLFSGTFTSQGVLTRTVTNSGAQMTTFSVLTGPDPLVVSTAVGAPDASNNQQVAVTVAGAGGFSNATSKRMDSNGSSYRGSAERPAEIDGTPSGDSVKFTNAPGKDLDLSLGASSLVYSYVGVGELRPRAMGSAGDTARYVFALFGGAKTTDMPTSGEATYAGGFEGVEQRAQNNSSTFTSRQMSGQAKLSVDFSANKVNGQITNIYTYTPTSTAQASYLLSFKGTIAGSGFSGTTSIVETQSNPEWYSTSSSLQGGFFGPQAAEAAGALAVAAHNGSQKILVTGAFGAKKQ